MYAEKQGRDKRRGHCRGRTGQPRVHPWLWRCCGTWSACIMRGRQRRTLVPICQAPRKHCDVALPERPSQPPNPWLLANYRDNRDPSCHISSCVSSPRRRVVIACFQYHLERHVDPEAFDQTLRRARTNQKPLCCFACPPNTESFYRASNLTRVPGIMRRWWKDWNRLRYRFV